MDKQKMTDPIQIGRNDKLKFKKNCTDITSNSER